MYLVYWKSWKIKPNNIRGNIEVKHKNFSRENRDPQTYSRSYFCDLTLTPDSSEKSQSFVGTLRPVSTQKQSFFDRKQAECMVFLLKMTHLRDSFSFFVRGSKQGVVILYFDQHSTKSSKDLHQNHQNVQFWLKQRVATPYFDPLTKKPCCEGCMQKH